MGNEIMQKDIHKFENNVIPNTDLWCDGQLYNFKKGMENCPLRENCKRWHKRQDNWYKLNRIQFNSIKEFRNCKDYLSA
jgi:hypothetical protein